MAEQRAAVDRMDVMRRWVEITPEGDWVAALRDEEHMARVHDFLGEVGTPDIEIAGIAGDGSNLSSPSRGVEGLVAFWDDWLSPWESFGVEIEGIAEGPDGVVVDAVQRGRLKGSTAAVESASAAVHFFSGGRLARIEYHLDRDAARRAAGL